MELRRQIQKMLGSAADRFLAIPAVSTIADAFEHRLMLARIEFSHEGRVAFFAQALDGLSVGSGCHNDPAEALMRCLAETLERRSVDAGCAHLGNQRSGGFLTGSAAHSDAHLARMNACFEFEERRTISDPARILEKLRDATESLGAPNRPAIQALVGEIDPDLHFSVVFTPRSLVTNQFGAKVACGADQALSGAYSEFLQLGAKATMEQVSRASFGISDQETLFVGALRSVVWRSEGRTATMQRRHLNLDNYTTSPVATSVEGWHVAICTGRID